MRRRFQRSNRGLSEIVGTLMLVVIVVSAAALLAAFVATYQKQLQTEEAFTHDQNLESIHILSLSTQITSGTFTSFAFTIASEYVNPSVVDGISINDAPLKAFSWQNVTTGASGTYTLGQNFYIRPFDQIIITLDLNPGDSTFSFLSSSNVPVPNSFIKFDIYTVLQNDFTRVFLPPTAIAVVSEINPSGNNPITLLDGSESFQSGTNSSIVNWGWTITSDSQLSTGASLSSATFTQSSGTTSNGALASGSVTVSGATATFTVPSGFTFASGNLPYFSLGGNLTVTTTGTGSCTPLSGSSISPGATGSVDPTTNTLTVTFGFVTTLPSACSAATLSLDATGITLVGPGMSTSSSAAGEEYEISPALALFAGEAPYSVALVVTNSDGLQGAISIAYSPVA